MRYPVACLAVLSLVLGVSQASGVEYPCRWVYVSKGLHQDRDVDEIRSIVQTAASHGLNGMVLSAGLDRLGHQPADYFKLKFCKFACQGQLC